MPTNPILDSNNQSIQIANLFGALGWASLNGLPLGATGDSALGEIYLKVGVVGGVSGNSEGKATAAAPTYVEASSNPLSMDLAGALRVTFAGSQLTPVSVLVSTGGTIAAGKKHIEFILSSDFAGNINGIAYSGVTDAVQTFDAPPGYTLAAIVYTRSAGSLRIISY